MDGYGGVLFINDFLFCEGGWVKDCYLVIKRGFKIKVNRFIL